MEIQVSYTNTILHNTRQSVTNAYKNAFAHPRKLKILTDVHWNALTTRNHMFASQCNFLSVYEWSYNIHDTRHAEINSRGGGLSQ